MSEEIIKVLDDLADRFGIAVDWTSQNVMPMLQQLFNRMQTYGITIHTFAIVICILVIAASVIYSAVLYKSYKQCLITKKDTLLWKWYDHYEEIDIKETGTVIGAAMIVASVMSIVVMVYNSVQLIKCIIIPELYALNYITNCIN